jgi:hypothetical protein
VYDKRNIWSPSHKTQSWLTDSVKCSIAVSLRFATFPPENDKSGHYHTLGVTIRMRGHPTCTSIKLDYKITCIYRGYITLNWRYVLKWSGRLPSAFAAAIQFPYRLYNLLQYPWVSACVYGSIALRGALDDSSESHYRMHGHKPSTKTLLLKYHSNKPGHEMM